MGYKTQIGKMLNSQERLFCGEIGVVLSYINGWKKSIVTGFMLTRLWFG